MTGDMWQVTHVTCHVSRVTCHMSHVTCHNFYLFIFFYHPPPKTKYWSYDPHRSRDSVSPVCGIFCYTFTYLLGPGHSTMTVNKFLITKLWYFTPSWWVWIFLPAQLKFVKFIQHIIYLRILSIHILCIYQYMLETEE